MTLRAPDRLQFLVVKLSSDLLSLVRSLSNRTVLACLVAAALAMAIRAAALPFIPPPEPVVHDEFAYLLGSETFAAGRLTNPPHPMWVHFETFHENFQPTYASKYPPVQSLLMAVGARLFGHPWFGIWLSFGCMCAALCWMLQGWMPAYWAFLGTLVAMAQIGVFGYWMDSYWGGAATATAGCLVLGALPRLARKVSLGTVLLGSLGLLALANSRPFEGLIATLGAGAGLLLWRRAEGRPIADLFAPRMLLAAALVIVPGVLWMGYYNFRVTGSPVVLPYTVNSRTYQANPQFYFLPAGPTHVYHHEMLRQYWMEWCREQWVRARHNPLQVLRPAASDIAFFFPAPVLFAFLAGALIGRGLKIRLSLAIVVLVVAALLLEVGIQPHYLAPAAGLILIPVMYSLRWLHVRAGHYGPALVILFLLFTWKPVAGSLAAGMREHRVARLIRDDLSADDLVRPHVESRLAALGGSHLVIVRYSPHHDPSRDFEIVYNHADIDGSPVVWARDMGATANRELTEYYLNRNVWVLDPDSKPWVLTPYNGS